MVHQAIKEQPHLAFRGGQVHGTVFFFVFSSVHLNNVYIIIYLYIIHIKTINVCVCVCVSVCFVKICP